MSLTDKAYETYYSVSGLVRPFTLAAYLRDRREADAAWERSRPSDPGASDPGASGSGPFASGAPGLPPARLKDIGVVESLSILPLVDFYSVDDTPGVDGPGHAPGTPESRFSTESGVSYLVTVDDRKILFDVGYNARGEHPSPLLRNMAALGVSTADLDAVMISHVHLDHVGGPHAQAARTFTLSREHVDLGGIPAYVPAPMTHPSAAVEVVTEGRKLGEGLASTGPLTRAIWLMGPVAEQSLLVNVKGKGMVMIVGCGHPSLSHLIGRATDLIDAPLYGVVGGLHFPVTGSRVGKGRQNVIGSGKPPWRRITRRDAAQAVAVLDRHDPGLIALSAHDSCDWTLDLFAGRFGPRYRRVLVGDEIVVA